MVVGHDDIYPRLLREGDVLVIGRAEVYRHDQVGAVRYELLHGCAIEPVAFVMTVRNVHRKVRVAELGQKIVHDDGAWNAVAVVVGVDDDLFCLYDRVMDTLDGLFHIVHKERVVHVLVVARLEEAVGGLLLGMAPIYQKPGQKRAEPFDGVRLVVYGLCVDEYPLHLNAHSSTMAHCGMLISYERHELPVLQNSRGRDPLREGLRRRGYLRLPRYKAGQSGTSPRNPEGALREYI